MKRRARTTSLVSKLVKLERNLKRMGRIVLAYSGGVDSTFLMAAAVRTLGKNNVVPVTAISPTYPRSERTDAAAYARTIGIRVISIKTDELGMAAFRRNPENRCYYCKLELFEKLNGIAKRRGVRFVIDGSNIDDLKDVRYGRAAAKQAGVRSPLQDAGLTKNDIRALSRRWGLRTWSKPSQACLASRIPFNEEIDERKLRLIERAESELKRFGLGQVRVRLHRDIARIELDEKAVERITRDPVRSRVVDRLKHLGIVYVTVDLQGYRTGSMHEPLRIDKK